MKLRERGFPVFVASLADELKIEDALMKLGIRDCISAVVGKADYSLSETNLVSAKVFLILKVAALAGVPPYRVLYVGDHNNDFLAAKQVGASFVEARVVGDASRITEKVNSFDHYSNAVKAFMLEDSDAMKRHEKRMNRLWLGCSLKA